MSDEAKKAILARRARFVAAALAATGCGKSKVEPPPDAEVVTADAAPPMPCLSAVRVPPEPVRDAGPPTPCLRIAAPRRDAGGCDPNDPLCIPVEPKTK